MFESGCGTFGKEGRHFLGGGGVAYKKWMRLTFIDVETDSFHFIISRVAFTPGDKYEEQNTNTSNCKKQIFKDHCGEPSNDDQDHSNRETGTAIY